MEQFVTLDLPPALALDALTLELEHSAIPSNQVLIGSPTTGHAELRPGFGVWEHTPGVSTDVESDELFVVLVGAATVEFDDGHPPLVLSAGTIARLSSGMRTTWTVTETLRKVYWTA